MTWFLAHPFPDEGGGGEGGRVAKLYDRKKVWSSINHSVLSGVRYRYTVGMNSYVRTRKIKDKLRSLGN
jgi:hypothetical protein